MATFGRRGGAEFGTGKSTPGEPASAWIQPAGKRKRRRPRVPSALPSDDVRGSTGTNIAAGELKVDDVELPSRVDPTPLSLALRARAGALPGRPGHAGPAGPAGPAGKDQTELMYDLPPGLRRDHGHQTRMQIEASERGLVPGSALERLPRRAGLLGDVRYVFTVAFGVTAARKELADVRAAIQVEHALREDKVLALAAQLQSDPSLVDAAPQGGAWIDLVAKAAARIAPTEEKTQRHSQNVVEADAALTAARDRRQDEAALIAAEHVRLTDKLKAVDEDLFPLQQRDAALRQRLSELRASHVHPEMDASQGQEGRGVLASDPASADAAASEAERASLKQREPSLLAEQAALEPQIARLSKKRDKLVARLAEASERDQTSQATYDSTLRRVSQTRAEEEQALAAARQEHRRELLRLGDSLCIERPTALGSRMAGIDAHDANLATLRRRVMELDERLYSIDKRAVARGLAVLLITLTVAVSGLVLLL